MKQIIQVAARRVNEPDPLTPEDGQCYLAALDGDHGAIIRWVRRGARIQRIARMGILVQVAERGHLDAARVLLDEGVDPNFGMARGKATPLFQAVRQSNVALVRLLLERGAKLDRTPEDAPRLLCLAAGRSTLEMIGFLLDAGLDVNLRGRGNWTPLHCAAQRGRVENARMLIERGADVHARNGRGATPLIIALGYGYPAVAAKLRNAGASEECVPWLVSGIVSAIGWFRRCRVAVIVRWTDIRVNSVVARRSRW